MAISIVDALDKIYQEVGVLDTQVVPLEDSLGRVIAKDYKASFNLPRFDNSAMDGYAIKLNDSAKRVNMIDVIYAGDTPKTTLRESTTIKIMTGAPIPKGCEAIVPRENVIVDDNIIKLPSGVKENAHIRREGEDIKAGKVFISKGERITPYSTALLSSQGITHIEVYRKVRVAIFSTGDELRPYYEKIEAHQLYNSNAPTFISRAKSLGCETIYINASGDKIEDIQIAITQALKSDIIITSGGVSVGDKDFTKEAFTQMGMEIFFEKIDIKPGKPTTFGKINDSFVVNLPGNPLASMVNFEMFIKPIILKLQGDNSHYHGVIETRLDKEYNIKSGKFSVILGKFDGINFYPLLKQAPGMVSPLQDSDAMMVVSPKISRLTSSKAIKIIPIKMLFNSNVNSNFIVEE
ncbi:Molybdopterin biosynthesis protein MoeA [hydrothermal vent metagenome]|uniref:molybdopterin molybdotransferase n=1 Tax=hydrothermal vent metagenome TaxID=652676 RepID=A0A1W1EHP2_9ZZZZ